MTTQKEKDKDLYEELSTEKPERQVELPEDGDKPRGPKTLSEKEEETPNLSDFQSTLKSLFPEFDDDGMNSIAQAAMVARIAPDVFSDLIYLVTMSILEKQDPRKNVDVISTLTKVYAMMSIGLDGKGRIDQIELHGASKEEKELEKLGRELF